MMDMMDFGMALYACFLWHPCVAFPDDVIARNGCDTSQAQAFLAKSLKENVYDFKGLAAFWADHSTVWGSGGRPDKNRDRPDKNSK